MFDFTLVWRRGWELLHLFLGMTLVRAGWGLGLFKISCLHTLIQTGQQSRPGPRAASRMNWHRTEQARGPS